MANLRPHRVYRGQLNRINDHTCWLEYYPASKPRSIRQLHLSLVVKASAFPYSLKALAQNAKQFQVHFPGLPELS